jgi:hypothetical protein
VVAKVRERLAVSKQAAHKFEGERFNVRKPNELEVRKEYQIEIENRFAPLENLDNDGDINRAWENIKENIQTSARESLGLHESKQHKLWFDEERLGCLDGRKQAQMQWMQDPCQSNVQNLDKVRRDVSILRRNKKKAYTKAKIEELETNSKIQIVRDLYRSINDFKQGYQPRTNTVKDEQGDLVVDSHSILARWRNYFSQILNVHGIIDVRQAEIHTAELLVPELSVSDIELAIHKLKFTNHQVLIK